MAPGAPDEASLVAATYQGVDIGQILESTGSLLVLDEMAARQYCVQVSNLEV